MADGDLAEALDYDGRTHNFHIRGFMRISFLVFVASLCVSGCASQFTQPVSGPTAKLRLKAVGPVTLTWIHTYDRPNCQGPQWMGAFETTGALTPANNPKGMVDSTVAPKPNVIEHIIPAKPTTILFTQHGPHSGGYVRGCKLAVNFKAEAGAEYEIGYGFDTSQCFASVDSLKVINGSVIHEPVRDSTRNMGDCIPFAF